MWAVLVLYVELFNMYVSSIDPKGVMVSVFRNPNITPNQAISELYHNADDSGAKNVKMFCTQDSKTDRGFFVFSDDGKGMDGKNIETEYLKMWSTNRKINTRSHGKFGFGGKQAILQLAGCARDRDEKSDAVLVVSKKKNKPAFICWFPIPYIFSEEWDGKFAKADLLNTDMEEINNFRKHVNKICPYFQNSNYHGTTILIRINNQIDELFANIEEIIYETSSNFLKRLDVCKLYIGETEHSLNRVLPYDKLHYDIVNNKYKKEIIVECYRQNRVNHFVVNDGGKKRYLRPVGASSKKTQNRFTPFTANIKMVGRFKILFSMVYELLCENKEITSSKRDTTVSLCRNDVFIGFDHVFKGAWRKLKSEKIHVAKYCRTRIEYEATNDFMDTIFCVSMNKCSTSYKKLPLKLKKTINRVYDKFLNSCKRSLMGIGDEEKNNVLKNVTPREKHKEHTMELDVSTKLARQLNGKTEEWVDGNRVDVLTNDHIIEVKRYRDRKAAIGQVLFYKMSYPNHTPRIHLFDHNGQRCTKMKSLCEKLKIVLTYE